MLAASPYHPLAGRGPESHRRISTASISSASTKICPSAAKSTAFCASTESKSTRSLHFDNLQMIKEAVAHHVGVSIMPARIMRDEIAQGRLVAIPIAAPELYRPLGIIHRKKKRFHRVAQAFLDLLCEKPAPIWV